MSSNFIKTINNGATLAGSADITVPSNLFCNSALTVNGFVLTYDSMGIGGVSKTNPYFNIVGKSGTTGSNYTTLQLGVSNIAGTPFSSVAVAGDAVITTDIACNMILQTGQGGIGNYGMMIESSTNNVSFGNAVKAPCYIDVLQSAAWNATTFDFKVGTNWYFSAAGTATQTAAINFSNLTAISGRSYTYTFILTNTGTAYYFNPSSVQCAGTTVAAANYKSNIGTLSNASNFIIQTFTCMYLGTNWYVLTSATSF